MREEKRTQMERKRDINEIERWRTKKGIREKKKENIEKKNGNKRDSERAREKKRY